MDLVTSYWEALASTREQGYFGAHFAANLSAAAVDADHGVDFYYNFAETWPVPSEEPIGASVLEQELEMAKVADIEREEEPIDSAKVEQEAAPARASAIEEANEYADGLVVEEELNVEMSEEVPGSNGEEMASFSQNLDIPSQPYTSNTKAVFFFFLSKHPYLMAIGSVNKHSRIHLDGCRFSPFGILDGYSLLYIVKSEW